MNRDCTLENENKKQIEKFREKARELECDESEEAFEKKMKNVVKENPTNNSTK